MQPLASSTAMARGRALAQRVALGLRLREAAAHGERSRMCSSARPPATRPRALDEVAVAGREPEIEGLAARLERLQRVAEGLEVGAADPLPEGERRGAPGRARHGGNLAVDARLGRRAVPADDEPVPAAAKSSASCAACAAFPAGPSSASRASQRLRSRT